MEFFELFCPHSFFVEGNQQIVVYSTKMENTKEIIMNNKGTMMDKDGED